MKRFSKWLWITIMLFIIANVFIFINRNKFEYVNHSGIPELYPEDPDASFLNKWHSYNKSFKPAELDQGLSLLRKHIGIDTVFNEKDKLIRIAGWLYKSFYQQQGIPDTQLSCLTPLQQYNFLKANSEKKLWCGHFQRMFGFFCTATGLLNRYVEIVPTGNSINVGYYEVNEVYLPGTKKWVMVDLTRNLFLIHNNNQVLSAAAYFDYRLKEQPATLLITCWEGDSILTKSLPKEISSSDVYFNKNYFLRYYLNLDLSEVYSPFQRIKRYVLGEHWYEIYSPGSTHSNILFRVKQFFFFGFLVSAFMLLFYSVKHHKDKPGQVRS